MSRGFQLPGCIPLKPIAVGAPASGSRGGPRTAQPAKEYGDERRCATCERPLSKYNPDAHCAPCYATIPLDKRPTPRRQGL